MDKERKELISLLDDIQKQCQAYAKNLTFNVKDEQTRVAICLYGSIIEYGECLASLARLERWIGFGPTLRAMLEAYVDLRNVLSNKTYVRNMEAVYYDKREKLYREALAGNNAFLDLVGKDPDSGKELQRVRQEVRGLKKNGFEKLHISTRFERAGMTPEYRSVYSFLCNESHNDLSSLLRRHINVENNRPTITFFKDPRPRDRVAEIFQAIELALFATEAIFQHCQGSLPDKYEEWKTGIMEAGNNVIEQINALPENAAIQPS